jgi:hypothetical protein
MEIYFEAPAGNAKLNGIEWEEKWDPAAKMIILLCFGKNGNERNLLWN